MSEYFNENFDFYYRILLLSFSGPLTDGIDDDKDDEYEFEEIIGTYTRIQIISRNAPTENHLFTLD